MEIERKFLADLQGLPENYRSYPSRQLEQGYISTDPAIRIRRDDTRYILTCKGQGLLKREEFELPLSEASFLHLKTKVEGNWIKKQRFFLPVHPDGSLEPPCGEAELTIELDIFDEPFAPLVYAEVEFPSEEAAAAFIPPAWFGPDVTLLPQYQNSALSLKKFKK
jgi:CYTH domain-containing protein